MTRLLAATLLASTVLGLPALAQTDRPDRPAPGTMPVIEEVVVVVGRTIPAVNFRAPGGAGTGLEMRSTALAPDVRSDVDVDVKQGYVQVQVSVWGLPAAATFGPEYMTYVLWAITPEGRTTNLGELLVESRGDRGRLEVTSELQAFGMIVTAEPHFSVTLPSDVVVLEAVPTRATDGDVEPVQAKFELLERGTYSFRGGSRADLDQPGGPFYLIQARNARRIAVDAGASQHASDVVAKGDSLLREAETTRNEKEGMAVARQAAQTFEDARLVTVKSIQEERQARAEEEARRAEAEARRAEEEARAAQDEAAGARVDARLAEADAAMARSELREAELEKQRLREQLRAQFAEIFETRETARGIVLTMPNVLFDVDRDTLRPEAREKLAKVAGIVIATPGLDLAVEGHADSTGELSYNQDLSERRAESVRSYLVDNGVPSGSLTARGYGETRPAAPNDTESGRQQNRRVEIVVTGDVIGRVG